MTRETQSSSSLPQWPPATTSEQLERLTLLATTYALSHGLLYLPPTATPNTPQPPAPPSAIHAPLSIFPTPFPRELFESAKRLQKIYNVLYARVAMDDAFLDAVMGEVEGVGKVDEFTGALWRGWKTVRDEGIVQPLHLGIFRSDYLLHASPSQPMYIKQVEFNTISSSFGALSERAAAMHRHLLASTDYFALSPHLKPENLPPNKTTSTIVGGLAAAHKAYGKPNASILFVVQGGERNVFDQRWLEYELLETHSIRVVRQTLSELATSATLNASNVLTITTPLHNAAEISTIYFRATYTPTDFPTPEHFATRVKLERSKAIKCPTLALQLAGGKKVQEVLTREGVLEKFLLGVYPGQENFTKQDVTDLRESWVQMWSLDSEPSGTSSNGQSLFYTLENHASLVLKPQREGGGNNVYKDSIPPFLASLPPSEYPAWIAMRLIEPPEKVGNFLARAGSSGTALADVVSELGIFGWALFGKPEGTETVTQNKEEEGGWLVRTKGRESDEGGVAVGFSVLDSIVLV